MDATQWTGFMAFGTATIACLGARQRDFLPAAALNGLCATECALGFRHKVHDAAVALMGEVYHVRTPYQVALTGLVLLAATLFLVQALRAGRGATRLAAVIAGGALMLFAVEAVSLHAIDSLLYHPVGPVLAIGWAWLLLGAGGAFAAVAARRR